MKNYKLIGNTEETYESVELGIIQADNMYECELFLALNFPQYYFGANIVEVLDPKDKRQPSFMCLCVKEYYTNADGTCPTPTEVALMSFNSALKINNGFCTTEYDREGTTYIPLKTLVIPLETNKK